MNTKSSCPASSETVGELDLNAPLRPMLALIIMSILWGSGWTALKIGLIDAPPFKFTALRMCVSALCLLALLPLTGRSFIPTRVSELVALALVQTSLLFTLSTLAIAYGSVGRIAFVVYTMPFFTLLFAWFLLGERVRGSQWIAIILAGGGLISIVQPWSIGATFLSNLLAVGAGATWAMGAVMVKRLQQRESMDLLSMTAWQMAIGSIPLLIISSRIPEAAIVWSPRFVAVLIFIAIFITALGWMLWVYALDNLEAGTASLATLASPLIAMMTSAIYFKERPSSVELTGMGLIFAALLVLSVRAMRPALRRASSSR